MPAPSEATPNESAEITKLLGDLEEGTDAPDAAEEAAIDELLRDLES